MLLVYAVETALAFVVALPLAHRVSSVVANLPNGTNAIYEPGSAHLLDVLAQNSVAWTLGALATLVLLSGVFLLSPVLQMTWLHALQERQRFSAAVANGLRQLGPAIRVSILLSPLFAIGLAVASIGGVIAGAATSGSANERMQFYAVLGSTVPGVLLMMHWAATHDLARAALATGQSRARDAVRRALRKSLRGLPVYILFLAIGLGLTLLGHEAGVRLDVGSPGSAMLVLLAQQSVSLTRILARGRWLVTALRLSA